MQDPSEFRSTRGREASTLLAALRPAGGRALWILRSVVLLRLAFHAVFLPVFEGPDEPFHLARARLFESEGAAAAWQGSEVDAGVVSAIRAWPCGEDLARAFGCPEYGREPAGFNILGPARETEPGEPVANYEAHQPPLYHAAAGAVLKVASCCHIDAPEKQLLLLRLLAVAAVAAALLGPVRSLGMREAGWEELLLGSLLLPGAAESLIRVSNDVAVFAWVAFLLFVLARPARAGGVVGSLVIGPLLKLTAWPVSAYSIVRLARARGLWAALAGTAASLLVVPLQWFRGWKWGGTLEATAPDAWNEGIFTVAAGLAHSALTFVKTAFWLGGWSVFRPPVWLLVMVAALAVTASGLGLRLRKPPRQWLAHAAAAAVFAVGFVIFAVGKRGVFGVWGAVGGWYFWGLAPWVALAACDFLEPRPGRLKLLVLAGGVILLISNVVWLREAIRLYGL